MESLSFRIMSLTCLSFSHSAPLMAFANARVSFVDRPFSHTRPLSPTAISYGNALPNRCSSSDWVARILYHRHHDTSNRQWSKNENKHAVSKVTRETEEYSKTHITGQQLASVVGNVSQSCQSAMHLKTWHLWDDEN